jgi:hypothetical protein
MRLNNFGAALDRLGRKDEARDAYLRAIRMDPSLDVSKRNLHGNVRSSMRVGAVVAGGAALGGVKLLVLNGAVQTAARLAGAGNEAGHVAVIALVIVIGVWIGRRVWNARAARQRAAELEARDPDLMRLYKQIDADIAAGRIRKY